MKIKVSANRPPMLTPEALLDCYYSPLANFRNINILSPLQEPLWCIRQDCLEDDCIVEKISEILHEFADRNDPVYIILKYTFGSSSLKKSINFPIFSQLSLTEKHILLETATKQEIDLKTNAITISNVAQYATSLLITLLLRDSNETDNVQIAFKLLTEGAVSGCLKLDRNSLKPVELKLISKNLLQVPFIDLSYINFPKGITLNIDLSGQYLKGMQLDSPIIGNLACFRYTALHNANFNKINFPKNLDFTGASLYKANLNNTKINHCIFNQVNAHQIQLCHANATNSQWENSNLYDANLKGSNFTQSNFQNARMLRVSFEESDISECRFEWAEGLECKALLSVRNKGLSSIRLTTKGFTLEDIQTFQSKEVMLKKGRATLLVGTKVSIPDKTTIILSNHDAVPGDPLQLWPKDLARWKHDPFWHGDNHKLKLCNLNPEELLYKTIETLIHSTSDAGTYQSRFLEFARAKKALDKGEFGNFVKQEFKQPPIHKGVLGSIQIKAIQINHNENLLRKYFSKKKQIKLELEQAKINNPLKTVTWCYGSLEGGLPVLDATVGECWLFHGASLEIMTLIVKGGFSTKFATANIFSGYGALGKGIYCSDDFSKVATYVSCPYCTRNQCVCSTETRSKFTTKKHWKAILVSRVILGKVFTDEHRTRRYEENLADGFHSAWGPSKKKHEESSFNCNEFIVADTDQIYPEFCVFYLDNYNLDTEKSPTTKTFIPTRKELPKELESTWKAGIKALDNYERLGGSIHLWQRLAAFEALQKVINIKLNKGPLTFSQLNNLNTVIQGAEQEWFLLKQVINDEKEKKLHDSKHELTLPNQEQYILPLIYYWAKDYYSHQNWEQILSIANDVELSVPYVAKKILFLIACANYHTKQTKNFLHAINRIASYKRNKVNRCLLNIDNPAALDYYYTQSFIALKEGLKEKTEEMQQSLCERIADWTLRQLNRKLWTTEEWHLNYEELNDHSIRKLFRDRLQSFCDKSKNVVLTSFSEHLPNELGQRKSVLNTRKIFHQQLSHHLLLSGDPEIEIAWLSLQDNGSYIIRRGPLNTNFVKTIFENTKNDLSWSNEEQQGRCVVRCLRDKRGIAIAYLKFYPQYPLRQFALDRFHARLSGYHAETTLGYVTSKDSTFRHPILLSMPLGPLEEAYSKNITLLHHHLEGGAAFYETQSDPELFSWKFFETILTSPSDDKNDNVIPVLVPHNPGHYAWVSFDTDRGLVHQTTTKKSVSVYAVNLLMPKMDEPIDVRAMRSFLKRDWPELFNAWLHEIEVYVTHLIGDNPKESLFDQTDLQHFQQLREKMPTSDKPPCDEAFGIVSGFRQLFTKEKQYQVACDPVSLFRDNDLLALYQQVQRLMAGLNECLASKTATTWQLFQKIDPPLANYYWTTYTQNKTATTSEKFDKLPGRNHNFDTKQIKGSPIKYPASKQVQKEVPIRNEVDKISMLNSKLLSTNQIFSSYKNLKSQNDELKNFIQYYNSFNLLLYAIQNQKNIEEFSKENYPDYLRERIINQLNWRHLSKEFCLNLLNIACLRGTIFNSLSLTNCIWLTKELFTKLIAHSYGHLKVLSLRNCYLRNEDLGSTINNYTLLEKIDVSHTSINKLTSYKSNVLKILILEGCSNLELIQIECPNLQQVNLENCVSLRDKNILDWLKNTPQLELLNLRGCFSINLKNIISLNLSKLEDLEINFIQQLEYRFDEIERLCHASLKSNIEEIINKMLKIHLNLVSCKEQLLSLYHFSYIKLSIHEDASREVFSFKQEGINYIKQLREKSSEADIFSKLCEESKDFKSETREKIAAAFMCLNYDSNHIDMLEQWLKSEPNQLVKLQIVASIRQLNPKIFSDPCKDFLCIALHHRSPKIQMEAAILLRGLNKYEAKTTQTLINVLENKEYHNSVKKEVQTTLQLFRKLVEKEVHALGMQFLALYEQIDSDQSMRSLKEKNEKKYIPSIYKNSQYFLDKLPESYNNWGTLFLPVYQKLFSYCGGWTRRERNSLKLASRGFFYITKTLESDDPAWNEKTKNMNLGR